jgi:hypothetical protein
MEGGDGMKGGRGAKEGKQLMAVAALAAALQAWRNWVERHVYAHVSSVAPYPHASIRTQVLLPPTTSLHTLRLALASGRQSTASRFYMHCVHTAACTQPFAAVITYGPWCIHNI